MAEGAGRSREAGCRVVGCGRKTGEDRGRRPYERGGGDAA